jgi:hypothetical protein
VGSTDRCNGSASFSAGVMNPNFLRGRVFKRSATALSVAWVTIERSVPLGKYCRRSPGALLGRTYGRRNGQHRPHSLVGRRLSWLGTTHGVWTNLSERYLPKFVIT